ncbi:DUF3299 domain-containing protein [Algoriphagus sp. AGSA1]|uniref:DUF3299 domain-containing protein n=1 Tax=Algoriphagus sp. AGSA1 TaxID=2907213 RepID=UPI001F21B143|nr:DUF3299 domain-containing protein [Algoriphagus sp. AGSA1]MCE7054641.1 DUF3299 domain-containing protein [Algoriphagus sp. AGSA1]
MLKTSLLIFSFFLAISAYSQTKIDWDILSDVTFTDKYSEEVQAYYYFPTFGPSVLSLNKKEVIIRGYVLEIDRGNDVYILSANPFAACFFCGGAGPESIVELKLDKDHPRFKMDQVVTFKGTLKLNAVDIYQCNYILENAKVYKN